MTALLEAGVCGVVAESSPSTSETHAPKKIILCIVVFLLSNAPRIWRWIVSDAATDTLLSCCSKVKVARPGVKSKAMLPTSLVVNIHAWCYDISSKVFVLISKSVHVLLSTESVAVFQIACVCVFARVRLENIHRNTSSFHHVKSDSGPLLVVWTGSWPPSKYVLTMEVNCSAVKGFYLPTLV